MATPWVTVNLEGLANTLSELDRFRIIWELVQNAMDTDGAKNIRVKLMKPRYSYSHLEVEDDDPKGFTDLRFGYELFADTPKRDDPTKAGRFTEGEKKFLALCKEASIVSTTGSVYFERLNGKENRRMGTKKREAGTLVTGEFEMTPLQYEAACSMLSMLVPHDGIRLTLETEDGSQNIEQREAIRSFKATLLTEFADKTTRKMTRKARETEIRLYELKDNETAHVYELGIPVVEIDCKWHIDVRQRIPLNSDRDNVTPAYKEALLGLVLNEAHDLLSKKDAEQDWVHTGLGSEEIDKEAFEDLKTKIHGEKTLIANPLDPESVSRGVSEGFNVIYPNSLSAGERENNKRYGTMQLSSMMFPTPKPYSDDPNAPMVEVVPEEKWSAGMKLIHELTVKLAQRLMKCDLDVRYVNTSNGFGACFGTGILGAQMDYNIRRLGRGFFDHGANEETLSLIIHEFAHYYERNHLSDKYYEACTDLGARLTLLALNDPKFFEKYRK